MPYRISQLSNIIHAHYLQKGNDDSIEHLLTDSRKLLFPPQTLFFALDNGLRKGSYFIDELYEKGVRNFIVDEHFSGSEKYSAANILGVKNVLEALQQMVAWHRSHFDIPVIGITGSNGKTIVKEWLWQLLQADHQVIRNPKSYNSQVGVPLSVWQMNETHTLGIFEAGISLPNEMENIERVILPATGVLTNIGSAHDEGFENTTQKIREKLKLFRHVKKIVTIHNREVLDQIKEMQEAENSSPGILSWGVDADAGLRILLIEKEPDSTNIKALYQNREIFIHIPYTDDASVENAISCWCVLLQMNMDDRVIGERMQLLQPVEMRLQLKQGINNCSVINDSYSADVNSLTIALDFLAQQQQHQKRTVILSDIIGSGKTPGELYGHISNILQQKNIHRLIGIGPEIAAHQQLFQNIAETIFFTSTAGFLKDFYSIHFSGENILVKGARVFGFEQIIRLLEQKVHQTFLEINLSAIAHNLKVYRQLLKPGTKLMAMVKASGYGSGSFEIANLLQFHKVDYLAVAYADEGVELRKAGIRLPVMVMNAEPSTFDALVQFDLEPEIYSFDILQQFESYLQRSGLIHYPVHIKLDTGMRRLGFEAADMDELCEKLASGNICKVQSVFSHLAASDAAEHDDFTREQAFIFTQCCASLQQALGYPFIRHIANTSAISRHPALQFDMVRLGIGMYGVDSEPRLQQQLQHVATLKTTVSQVKKVKAGSTVGYNRSGRLTKDSLIATVRIGYADGYPRILGNGTGTMQVKGAVAPVIGNVCMDMTMLDVTGIAGVEAGDEVIVFGKEQPVSIVAAQAKTITYEILTGISQRVQRLYYEE